MDFIGMPPASCLGTLVAISPVSQETIQLSLMGSQCREPFLHLVWSVSAQHRDL